MMTHGVSLLLISAAAGYWVLTMAGKEKGGVKQLGRWLGLILIVVSLLGAACKVYCLTNCPKGKAGWMGKACPFTGKGMPAPSQKSSPPEG